VVTSLIDVSNTGVDLGAIKILRLLRTLRPLRLLHHNKSMKLIVTTLLESLTGILNMILVLFLVWLMFAILGVSLMKGKMNYCNFSSSGPNYDIYTYHQQLVLLNLINHQYLIKWNLFIWYDSASWLEEHGKQIIWTLKTFSKECWHCLSTQLSKDGQFILGISSMPLQMGLSMEEAHFFQYSLWFSS